MLGNRREPSSVFGNESGTPRRGSFVAMAEAYRSYLIRVRRGRNRQQAVRLDVEDLLGGLHAAIVGEQAAELDDRLRSLVGPIEPEPGTDAKIERPKR